MMPLSIKAVIICPYYKGEITKMCGIVGYIGENQAKEILLDGLEKLEYRGYDSAGIAVMHDKEIQLTKVKGRIILLRDKVTEQQLTGNIGIGHTRWATHGEASERNAHPHQSMTGRFTIVHNGVIENYSELRETYLAHVELQSETDTEIIVQLLEKMMEESGDLLQAFQQTLMKLKGSYAIALLDNETPDVLYAAKNKSPLLVGLGKDCHVVTSDAMATLQETRRYVELEDQEIVILSKDAVSIQKLNGSKVERASFEAKIDLADMEKGTYPHYMLKEIDEQSYVIRKIIQKYMDESQQLSINTKISNAFQRADRIYIIAAGTSYHAGLVGKQMIETLAGIPVEVHIASEFSYNMPLLSDRPLFVFISQSGETADCRSVLVQTKAMGYPALTITNVPGSTLSRESDYTLHLHAGPEIAVASTKAYTAQVAVLAILANDLAKTLGRNMILDLSKELSLVTNAIEVLTNQKEEFERITTTLFQDSHRAFFIGRGIDYFVMQEAALKLKEISYIQAEGFAGGELKHGTIALIEDGTPVIALATQEKVNLSIRGNVQEVAARGANTCIVSRKGLAKKEDAIVLPEVHELLTPLISVIPMQLLAYYAALHRGCDVDKPRNLAKSVTVE